MALSEVGDNLAAPRSRADPLTAVGRALARQLERWVLWSPVFAGLGAAGYLALRSEPGWPAALFPLIAALGLRYCTGRFGMGQAAVAASTLVVFAAAGFAAGKVRTASVMAPIAEAAGAVPVAGWVVDVTDPSRTGARLLIAPVRIGDRHSDLPRLLRVTSSEVIFGPGAAVSFMGLVNPPPAPASPGGYDFGRNAFFRGIGGSGVALTDPVIVDLPRPDWNTALAMRINSVRWSLAQRIAARMSPTARGLGVAMVTGHEAWIDPETEQQLRDSGLAHIVSISGLHMAIVGGFAFFLMRFLIAAIPPLALRVPGKKIGAAFGLLAVGSYLLISGAPPPAIRAAITAGVAFAAVLADRKAITLRALAVAALIILFLQPEAVAEPGFQMSFAATAALVALAEAWTGRPREINTPWPIRIVQGVGFWLAVSLFASLVAGMATGPFSIQHFNRVAVFGLPANMAAQPLSTFVMMPALALGAALEPLGLGAPFLALASWSIDALQSGAAWFAARPGAVMMVSSAPAIALPIAFLGILWLCIWKGRGRWLGLPLALAVSLWPRPEAPVAWIDGEGAQAAVRVGRDAVFLRPESRLFGAEYWARRHALVLPETTELRDEMFICNGSGCQARASAPLRLSIHWTARRPNAEALEGYCREAEILALRASLELPPSCQGVRILTRDHFEAGGGVEIFADGRMAWTAPRRGVRPWSQPRPG